MKLTVTTTYLDGSETTVSKESVKSEHEVVAEIATLLAAARGEEAAKIVFAVEE